MQVSLPELVSELIEKLGFSGHSIVLKEGHRRVVAVETPFSKELIGVGGETLRALNTLARRLWEAAQGEGAAGFLIDVDNYYEQKLEGVRANARMLAQRARLFKHDVDMPPLSPYERLVVHELFAEDPEIKTESAGEGKFRHIVLKYREASASKA